MIRYAAIINDLAALNADLRQYDLQFRQMRAKSSALNWCEVHCQSWLEAMHTPGRPFRDGKPEAADMPRQTGKPVTRSSRAFAAGGPQPNPHPRGVCWFYHDGVRWQGCQYNQRCYKWPTPGGGEQSGPHKIWPPEDEYSGTQESRPIRTPVRLANLGAYISSYDPSLSEYLLSGYICGQVFRCTFKGRVWRAGRST